MKKNFLFIILTTLVFIGCNKDDNSETKKDPIIGVWNEWSDSGEEYSDCQKKTTMEFTTDGKIYIKRFALDNSNQCINKKVKEGYWKLKESNIYTFILNSKEITLYVDFSNNNKILKMRGDKEDTKNYDEYRKL